MDGITAVAVRPSAAIQKIVYNFFCDFASGCIQNV